VERRVDGIHLAPFEQGEIGPDLFRHACLPARASTAAAAIAGQEQEQAANAGFLNPCEQKPARPSKAKLTI
jgi:hypothetical protein